MAHANMLQLTSRALGISTWLLNSTKFCLRDILLQFLVGVRMDDIKEKFSAWVIKLMIQCSSHVCICRFGQQAKS